MYDSTEWIAISDEEEMEFEVVFVTRQEIELFVAAHILAQSLPETTRKKILAADMVDLDAVDEASGDTQLQLAMQAIIQHTQGDKNA
jgi:hypothetical protein